MLVVQKHDTEPGEGPAVRAGRMWMVSGIAWVVRFCCDCDFGDVNESFGDDNADVGSHILVQGRSCDCWVIRVE